MPSRKRQVFINVPFDRQFESLYVALIVTLISLGQTPRSTLELPYNRDRLRRILQLLRACDSSIHDLSRVEIPRKKPRWPRFNMPFEAGVAIGVALSPSRKPWHILERKRYRLLRTLSDLNGYESHSHEGTVEGMVAALLDIYWREGKPSPPEIYALYLEVRKKAVVIKRNNNNDLFRPRAFRELRSTTTDLARKKGFIS
jgi:hypothetical protein